MRKHVIFTSFPKRNGQTTLLQTFNQPQVLPMSKAQTFHMLTPTCQLLTHSNISTNFDQSEFSQRSNFHKKTNWSGIGCKTLSIWTFIINKYIYLSSIKHASIKLLNNTAQQITKEFHIYVCSLLVYAPSQSIFFCMTYLKPWCRWFLWWRVGILSMHA